MKAKEKHKKKMIEFWSDPDNEILKRSEMYEQILNIKRSTFYTHFSKKDLFDIEEEAFDLRRKNSASQRTLMLKSLYDEGIKGSVPAAKEFLDRTEGKVKESIEHSGPDGGPIQTHTMDSDALKKAMEKK